MSTLEILRLVFCQDEPRWVARVAYNTLLVVALLALFVWLRIGEI